MNNLFKFRMLGVLCGKLRALTNSSCIHHCCVQLVLPKRNGVNAQVEMLSISMIYANFYHVGRRTMINPKINKWCTEKMGKTRTGRPHRPRVSYSFEIVPNPTYLYDSRLLAQVLWNTFCSLANGEKEIHFSSCRRTIPSAFILRASPLCLFETEFDLLSFLLHRLRK